MDKTLPKNDLFADFLELYDNGHSDQDERVLKVLEKVAGAGGYSGQSGLRGLPEVLGHCGRRAGAGLVEFEDVLVKVLSGVEAPLDLCDLRDESKQRLAVLNTLDAVSGLLVVANERVQSAAAKVVTTMISDMRCKGHDDLNPPKNLVRKRDTRFKAIFNSQTLTTLTKVITSPSLRPFASLECLRALRDSSCYITAAKRLLTEEDVLTPLVSVLSNVLKEHSIQDDRVTIVVETLWNLLDLVPECRKDVGSEQCLGVMYLLFKNLLWEGHRLKDKEMRNDLLTVMAIVAGDQTTHENFFKTGWTDIVWTASCGGEVVPADPSFVSTVKPFAATTSQDDFDMKKILWHLLYLLSFTQSNLELILSKNTMSVLLSYLNTHCDVPAIVRWPLTQLVDLQHQALQLISQTATGRGSKHFADNNGPRILLSFLSECVGDGLRNATLKVLSRVAETENKAEVAEQGAVGIILGLAEATTELEVKSNCVRILSSIVDCQPELQKQFAEAGGIEALLLFLTLDQPRTQESDELVFSTIDCIWSCIIGSEENEMNFVEMEGIHALLDELTVAPPWVCASLLSCLIDFIASYSAVTDELLEWRGATGATLAQVLIKMWEADSKNSILPPSMADRPFESIFMEEEIQSILEYGEVRRRKPSERVLDTQGLTGGRGEGAGGYDLKAKIFCVFIRAYQRDCQALKGLNNSEKVQLQVILAYMSLRRDRVWVQIDEALKNEDTVPIGQDRKRLEFAKAAAAVRWEGIRAEQMRLQVAADEQDDVAEKTFYKLLVKKKDDVAKNTQKNTGLSITEAKIRKAQMLKASFMSVTPAPDSNKIPPDRSKNARAGNQSRPGSTTFDFKTLEFDITALIISIRTDPAPIIAKLEALLASIGADGTVPAGFDGPTLLTEGKAGIMQAISFLKTLRGLPPLCASPGLSLAAADHTFDQRDKDQLDHVGGDNSTALSRMNRYGMVVGSCSESFSLGQNTAMGVVIDLVINDGVASKADRLNMFSPNFKFFGVSCSYHKVHQYQCVIDYAADYQNKPRVEQQSIHARFEATHHHGPLPVAIPVL